MERAWVLSNCKLRSVGGENCLSGTCKACGGLQELTFNGRNDVVNTGSIPCAECGTELQFKIDSVSRIAAIWLPRSPASGQPSVQRPTLSSPSPCASSIEDVFEPPSVQRRLSEPPSVQRRLSDKHFAALSRDEDFAGSPTTQYPRRSRYDAGVSTPSSPSPSVHTVSSTDSTKSDQSCVIVQPSFTRSTRQQAWAYATRGVDIESILKHYTWEQLEPEFRDRVVDTFHGTARGVTRPEAIRVAHTYYNNQRAALLRSSSVERRARTELARTAASLNRANMRKYVRGGCVGAPPKHISVQDVEARNLQLKKLSEDERREVRSRALAEGRKTQREKRNARRLCLEPDDGDDSGDEAMTGVFRKLSSGPSTNHVQAQGRHAPSPGDRDHSALASVRPLDGNIFNEDQLEAQARLSKTTMNMTHPWMGKAPMMT